MSVFEEDEFEQAQLAFFVTPWYLISTHTTRSDYIDMIKEIYAEETSEYNRRHIAKFLEGGELYEYVPDLLRYYAQKNKEEQGTSTYNQRMESLGGLYDFKVKLETSGQEISHNDEIILSEWLWESYDPYNATSMMNACYYYFVEAFQKSGLPRSYLYSDNDGGIFGSGPRSMLLLRHTMERMPSQDQRKARKLYEIVKQYSQRITYQIKMGLRIEPDNSQFHFYHLLYSCLTLTTRANIDSELLSYFNPFERDSQKHRQRTMPFFGIDIRTLYDSYYSFPQDIQLLAEIEDIAEEPEFPSFAYSENEPVEPIVFHVPNRERSASPQPHARSSRNISFDFFDVPDRRPSPLRPNQPARVDFNEIPPELVPDAFAQLGPNVEYVYDEFIPEDQTEARRLARAEMASRQEINPMLLFTETARTISEENAQLARALRQCLDTTQIRQEIGDLQAQQQYLKKSLLACKEHDLEAVTQEEFGNLIQEHRLMLASDGQIYAQSSLEHLQRSPVTREYLDHDLNIPLNSSHLSDAEKMTQENIRLADALRQCVSSEQVIYEINALEERQRFLQEALNGCENQIF